MVPIGILNDISQASSNAHTLEDYIKHGGAPRLLAKNNLPTPHRINPATLQTTHNFNKAFMNQPWFQQKYLLRKRNALRCDQHLYDFRGDRIPYERGVRYTDIGAGTIAHSHTGIRGAPGSLLHHNYDKLHTHPYAKPNPLGIPIYNPDSVRVKSQF